MFDVYAQLKRIRAEGVEFFVHVDALEITDSDVWRALGPADRQRSEDIFAEIGRAAAKIEEVLRRGPLLGEDAIRTIHRDMRRMESALRFRQWEGWETHTEWHEGSPVSVVPGGEYENCVPACTAQSLFEEAIDQLLRLVRYAESATRDETLRPTLAQSGLNENATVPQVGNRTHTPGPETDFETARQVANIVECTAPDGYWKKRLEEICQALDATKVRYPKTWPKRKIQGWEDAAIVEPGLAKKAIDHWLDVARGRKKTSTKTLS